MSDIIIESGSLSRPISEPYEVKFTNAIDLIFPFDGAVIIPKPNAEISDFQIENTSEWIYHSIRYPMDAGNNEMTFPTLYNFKNEPFQTEGSILALVAQDHTLLDDIDFSNLFNDERYTPTFKENLSIASLPKYFIIKFDEIINFPEGQPVSKKKGAKLKNNTDSQLAYIKSALTSAQYSGTIYAFDYAGHQTECASALLNLEVDKTIENMPSSNITRVQFVDLHGNVILDGSNQITDLNFDPPLENWDNTNLCYTVTFPTTARKLTLKQNPVNNTLDDAEIYLHNFHHVGFWPGYSFPFKEITTTDDTVLDLAKDLNMLVEKAPAFLRLCLFHPSKEFQTSSGGGLDKNAVFKLTRPNVSSFNSFKLFHGNNNISVFNDGKSFMQDLYKSVNQEEADWVLKEIYLSNWQVNAHLHMKGSMSAYNISTNNEDVNAVDNLLNFIANHNIVINFSGHNPSGSKNKFLLLPSEEENAEHITSSFWVESVTIPSTSEKSKTLSKGFARAESLYTATLLGDPDLKDHQLKVSWKNSLGQVNSTVKTLTSLPTTIINVDIPDEWFSLKITNDDPAKAVLKRTTALANIENQLGLSPGHTAELLLINQSSGLYEFISFNPEGGNANGTDEVLNIFDKYMAEDVLIALIIDRLNDENQEFTNTTILTSARTLSYSNAEHLAGSIPLHEEELGGMLRTAVFNGVKVRALLWEQFLANVEGGTGIETGHSNNTQISAIINKTINGKRGYAVLDRSTRPFGSFHQKATVLVYENTDLHGTKRKNMIAYLGGMDLAHGRWDTSQHHAKDPERKGGAWFDVHLKVEGNAVHDILLNFKQRWEAIDEFLDTNNVEGEPVNPDAGISENVNSGIKIETDASKLKEIKGDTFIQINRTIPPFSVHAEINTATRDFVSNAGEDGSFQSYVKAIQNAKKFILINEQYFFNVELALTLHESLKQTHGPKCLILVLPKDLSENDKINPLLFKARQKAIQALIYGANYNGPTSGAKCAHYTINPDTTTPNIKDKVVILYPTNADGKGVYVHSKHIIVDDVFMMIGSSNINYRSMSYDWEINAACVGKKLFKGATHNIRKQRMEICRILSGVPKAYTALLQDYYATFRLLKKIESEGSNPTSRLHPLKPRVKKLNPKTIENKAGSGLMDSEIDFVINLDINSPMLNFMSCNVLDSDGRDTDGDQLGVLAGLIGAGKNTVNTYALLSFNFGCDTIIKSALNNGETVFLDIHFTINITNEDDSTTVQGPFKSHQLPLKIGEPLDNIVIKGITSGEITVPISTTNIVTITASIDNATTPINCTAEVVFNPAIDTLTAGTYERRTLTLTT